MIGIFDKEILEFKVTEPRCRPVMSDSIQCCLSMPSCSPLEHGKCIVLNTQLLKKVLEALWQLSSISHICEAGEQWMLIYGLPAVLCMG